MKIVPDRKKIHSALRSLFRYSKMKELQAPDILFENEEAMISRRVKSLTPEEMFIVVSSWENYCREQRVEDEIQNQKLDEDLNQYYQSIN